MSNTLATLNAYLTQGEIIVLQFALLCGASTATLQVVATCVRALTG